MMAIFLKLKNIKVSNRIHQIYSRLFAINKNLVSITRKMTSILSKNKFDFQQDFAAAGASETSIKFLVNSLNYENGNWSTQPLISLDLKIALNVIPPFSLKSCHYSPQEMMSLSSTDIYLEEIFIYLKIAEEFSIIMIFIIEFSIAISS
jgi:hypothetical protein